MLTAITRAVSPAIVNCELTFVARQPIDLSRAREQHRAYEQLLEKLGTRVLSLPAEPNLPDSMFVEDPAIVLDELAVILPLGTESRRPEAASLAQALSKFRKIEYVTPPGTLEGGDVLRIDRQLFVGLSSRTNAEGIRQLAAILAPHGYEVISVPVTRCLHVTPLDISELQKAESGLTCSSLLFDAIDHVTAECDALVERMQTPQSQEAMKAAFDATPAELGHAALAAMRRRK